MKKTRMVSRSALAAAVASALIGAAPASARTTAAGERSPSMMTDGRSVCERVDTLNLVLAGPLEVRDASGATFLNLPTGTRVGRQRIETKFAAAGLAIRQLTELRDVILSEETVLAYRATGGSVTLPVGTQLRVKLDQGMDANGSVMRDRIDLRAVRPDGIEVRIRARAPEIDVVATGHSGRRDVMPARPPTEPPPIG